jgi:hypothetical protein
MKEGIPLPQRIENAPSLLPGLELYYIAFMDLMASRNSGFGIGAIWWSEVDKYCARHEIVGDQYEDMQYHIKNLDTAFVKHSAKKSS